MSHLHTFILSEGQWVGEGTVSFSNSDDQLYFVTNWGVQPANEEGIHFFQEVKTEGVDDPIKNNFHIYDVKDNAFTISLSNAIVGKVIGSGIIDEKMIAWEFTGDFTGDDTIQGYEVYTKKENGDYGFHAEYTSPDQFRTIIDGRIQKKE